MQNRDLLHIERVAIVAAEVAHAVEEDIVAGGEASDGEVVALCAAFARGDADAGHVAQGIAQCGRSLVLDDVLGNDIDGLRRVDQRLRELRQRNLYAGIGDVNRSRHALNFEQHLVGPGQMKTNAGAGQQLLQRRLGRVEARDTGRPDGAHRVSRHGHVEQRCLFEDWAGPRPGFRVEYRSGGRSIPGFGPVR